MAENYKIRINWESETLSSGLDKAAKDMQNFGNFAAQAARPVYLQKAPMAGPSMGSRIGAAIGFGGAAGVGMSAAMKNNRLMKSNKSLSIQNKRLRDISRRRFDKLGREIRAHRATRGRLTQSESKRQRGEGYAKRLEKQNIDIRGKAEGMGKKIGDLERQLDKTQKARARHQKALTESKVRKKLEGQGGFVKQGTEGVRPLDPNRPVKPRPMGRPTFGDAPTSLAKRFKKMFTDKPPGVSVSDISEQAGITKILKATPEDFKLSGEKGLSYQTRRLIQGLVSEGKVTPVKVVQELIHKGADSDQIQKYYAQIKEYVKKVKRTTK